MIILKIALISYVFYLLTDTEEIFGWYGQMIMDLPMWLYKPLGGCFRCFAGQVAFWYYLLANYRQYDLIEHLFFASAVIFLVIIINKIYEYVKEN